MNKSVLRKEAKLIRSNIENKEAKDKLILNNLFNLDIYKNAKSCLLYYPMEDEINIKPVIYDCLKNKKPALPVMTGGNIEFYEFEESKLIQDEKTKIFQPDINNKKAKGYDFCIVPGLLFSKKGDRLGYGKGYYDRFLKDYEGIKVALCYDELLFDDIITDKHDIKMDYIITQSGVFNVTEG